ncbi:hypothetical protein PHLGIDRAFT_115552 [Phlebiopsis gigantea 11061_1 CR5-6]|uniref:Uncharacterized protein n=1 Tax=Phlebiopsis gigantea (strain 11061_1 CR5-6) TaxID=745531 RepID=A0A0C3SBY4_PHLG1|nr:hypothetical protein PHLGIDRAFT_115552 [Phlebiopsis gigantea 11061_1 CR5-6]
MCLHTPPPPPQADPPVLRLHVDLLHAIFKLMDKTTLSMCSMVVPEDERGEHFTPPPLQDLLDFLDANPSVGEHIHALSLTMLLPTDDPYDIGGRRFRGGRWETLSAILRRTQDLRILEVHHLAITEPLSHADITSLAEGPALSHVDNLHVNLFGLPLETVHGDYIPRLFQLVGTINKLEFDSFIFPSPTLDSARKLWPTYTLKHLLDLSPWLSSIV